MLEPQSTLFFVVLLAMFAGLAWWLMKAKHVAIRIIAAFLAFVPAMMFGVATVNKYYDYYQTWGSAAADLTSSGVSATTITAGESGTGTGFSVLVGNHINLAIASRYGLTLRVSVHGPVSNITRTVYVFLPPQYFQAGYYQKYHFPVIELIHGFPGQPQDWIAVLGANTMLDSLVSQHEAKPAVLVMPDANGARGVSLQCLNQAGGPQDDTFLSHDLPDFIAARLRVQQPGTGWGIAGYSEGGFCAANLALQHGRVYSFAGVLSGYFRPSVNQLISPVRDVSPFGGNRRAAALNTPLDLLRSLPLGRPVPQFWLGAGLLDAQDVHSAENFGQLLQLRQPGVTVKLTPGDGHTMLTWRGLLPGMLSWMTRGLSQEVTLYNSPAAQRRRAAEARIRAKNAQLDQRRAQRPVPKDSVTPGATQPRLDHRTS
ncbi:MAG: esterase family protein [Actinomycetota bacterium]|nr:esterase family protein [Actinomycetota bacterium]